MSKLVGYAVAYVGKGYGEVAVGVMVVEAESLSHAIEQGVVQAKESWPNMGTHAATACEIRVTLPTVGVQAGE